MITFSTKKLHFLAKCCVSLMLALTAVTVARRWRSGGRAAAWAYFAEPWAEEYERQVLEDEARVVPGLGEGGAPAQLAGDEQRRADESTRMYGASWYLSDRISYTRTLQDNRHPACAGVEYDAELPSASVIIPFHNDLYSALLRTVWNILNTARRDRPWHKNANFVDRETGRITTIGYPGQAPDSEHVYLKEIILVDDASTLPELRGKLAHYVRTRLPRGLVRLLRLPTWGGLVGARQAGARAARGDALLVLDAHCEGLADWIRPLLQRLKDKRTVVLCPNLNELIETTFEYKSFEKHTFEIGGFQFSGDYWGLDMPAREWRRRPTEIAPTLTPTMGGSAFAVSRSYYWELGGFDDQMTGWGGENIEMSFRIATGVSVYERKFRLDSPRVFHVRDAGRLGGGSDAGGGSIEVIPCARLGHLFRRGTPYRTDKLDVNTARVAEVWMDEYAELYYVYKPHVRGSPAIGDVSDRRALRERLRCKSFQWYLDTVYPEKYVPVRDVVAFGRVKNALTGVCLDSMGGDRQSDGLPLGMYPCSPALTPSQFYSLTLTGQLRDELKCVELQRVLVERDGKAARRLLQVNCDLRARGQQWEYLRASQQLRHVESGLCVDAAGVDTGEAARARRCRHTARYSQQWTFDYDDANSSSDALPPDAEQRLRQIRRRRTRSRPAEAARWARRGT